ncbi:Transcriptional regulator, contains XRE-family HTH domain [Streptomyces mirabilis]|uniref:Transcriptional regulator, contains XRE-family HTH domain n=2 Tax=Streptomyces mirabilis TaxID=68239 RepID=A0A1I2SH09_9ACTN|nr:Transcriptional regulator, contains XRE-family HTH domain [Streptomyces mirabilis]
MGSMARTVESASGQSADSGLGRYLRARRAEITPDQTGLTTVGIRRTPGLRREELAALAGISIDYYIRLERGKEIHPSPSVIDSLARALRLDAHELRHLRDLAVLAGTGSAGSADLPPTREVRPGVLALTERLRPNPVFILGRTLDVLACNPSALQLFAGLDDQPPQARNIARYVFLHPRAPEVLDDWDERARACVARLRMLAGTDPGAPDLTDLVGELVPKSKLFETLWERYDIKPHSPGIRLFHHPEVGDLHLAHESMPVDHSPKHRFVIFFAEPDSPDQDKVALLDKGRPRRPHPDGERADGPELTV